MGFRYAVIGSGRQGTAAAYDLARFGEADSIAMADQNLVAAEHGAAHVNSLTGREVARPAQLDGVGHLEVRDGHLGAHGSRSLCRAADFSPPALYTDCNRW